MATVAHQTTLAPLTVAEALYGLEEVLHAHECTLPNGVACLHLNVADSPDGSRFVVRASHERLPRSAMTALLRDLLDRVTAWLVGCGVLPRGENHDTTDLH